MSNRDKINTDHYGYVEEDADRLLVLTIRAIGRLRTHAKNS